MRRISRRIKVALSVTAATIVAVNGGIAWAYWGLSGQGSASVASGTAIQLQVTGVPQPNSPLYPGVTTGLKLTITNPNSFGVLVFQIKPGAGSTVVDAAHAAAGCVQSGLSLASPTYGVSLQVPANSTRQITLPFGLKMTNASDSACQGATFTVPVTAVGKSI